MSLEECIQTEPEHVNTIDELGLAPLHWAVMRRDLQAVQILIDAGASIDQQTSHDFSTPLLLACQLPLRETFECVKQLLKSGASPHRATRTGRTALHYAVQQRTESEDVFGTVQLLLSRGASPRARTRDHDEPLHWIESNGSLSAMAMLVRLLIDQGADLEAKNLKSRTPLLYAMADGWLEVAHVFLELGADIFSTDFQGSNWLSVMVAYSPCHGNPSLLPLDKLLGTDPDALNNYGHSAICQLARRVGNPGYWRYIVVWWAVEAVALIVAIREANWKAGLYLDKEVLVQEDGSHARLIQWVARQRRLMERDPSHEDAPCTKDDIRGWYESEESDDDDDAEDMVGFIWSEDDENEVFHDALEDPRP